MSKAIKCDGTSTFSYVELALAPQSEVWVTYRLGLTAAALAIWTDPGSGNYVEFEDLFTAAPFEIENLDLQDAVSYGDFWFGSGGQGSVPAPVEGWQLCESHYHTGVEIEFFVAATQVWNGTPPGVGDIVQYLLGIIGESAQVPDEILYIKDLTIGTTRGGSDVFAWNGTDLSQFTVTGDVSVVNDPFDTPAIPTIATPQGVCIAFDAATLDPDAQWTRLDDRANLPGLSIQEWTIDRGRNSETDGTDTGTATVTIIDTNGTLDPTNTSGPFFGKLDPTKQAAIALQNPVTLEWSTLFTGFVADWLYDWDVSLNHAKVTLELVDLFEIFAALEMTPGNQGDTVPAGSEGEIFFAGALPPGGGASVFKHVNQRIIQALNDAGVPTVWQNVFSGNVTLLAVVMKRRAELMQVLQDAVDAEFPGGLARQFISKTGIYTFHGRFAYFFPERPGYGINTWKAGDATAVALDPDCAPIASLSARRSRDDIVNAALNLPQGVDVADVPTALVKDDTSIATHGWRFGNGSSDNLLTYQGHDEDGNTTDAVTETKRFSTYRVDNQKDPRTRVSEIGFRPRDPNASGNPAALWALMCGVELGDLISPLKTTHPGGGGFDEDEYVDHISYTAKPLREDFPEVDLKIEVSPRSYFDSNPFGEAPDNDDMAGAFDLPGGLGDTTGNSVGFSNEGADPVAATSKDPIVQTFRSLFTGPGGDYGDEATDTHNFRTAWYKFTAPGDWSGTSSFGVTLHGQTAVSALIMVKPGVSGVPPDNGDFTALGTGGVVNTPGDKTDLTETETGDATVSAGDVVYIGVGSMEDGGEQFDLSWTYLP